MNLEDSKMDEARRYVIDIINEAFDKSFSSDSRITIHSAYEFEIEGNDGLRYYWKELESPNGDTAICVAESRACAAGNLSLFYETVRATIPPMAVICLKTLGRKPRRYDLIVETVSGSIKYGLNMVYAVNSAALKFALELVEKYDEAYNSAEN